MIGPGFDIHPYVIFPAELSRRAMERLRAQGNQAELFEIEGTSGHLDGIFSIGKAADASGAFLAARARP